MKPCGGGRRARKLPFWKSVLNGLVIFGGTVVRWATSFFVEVLDRTVRVSLGFILGFTLALMAVIASFDLLWPMAHTAAKLLAWLVRLFLRLVL